MLRALRSRSSPDPLGRGAKAGTHEPRRSFGPIAFVVAGGAATLAVTLWYWRVWDGGLGAPIAYSGDALLYQRLAKTVVERGWYYTNPLLGAPAGQILADYPLGTDNLHFVTFRVLALFTSNPFTLVNTFYYLTFPLVFASACYALRRLGMALVVAVPLSVVYALAPFHFSRNTTHLFLAAYYAVPVACLLLYELLAQAETGEPGEEEPAPAVRALLRSRAFWLGRWLWVPVLLASTGAYFAFFFVVLAGAVGILAALSRRDLRQLARPGLVVAITLGAVILNDLPTFLYRADHGTNRVVAQRKLGESDIFALQWSYLVLPIEDHRARPLAQLREKATRSVSLNKPREQEALGAIAALGFVVSLGALVVDRRNRGRWAGLRRRSGVFNLLAVLLGVVGGGSLLLGLMGFVQLRAYARLTVFIAFFSLVTIGATAMSLLERRRELRPSEPSARRRGVAAAAVLVVVTGLAAWDQTPGTRLWRQASIDTSGSDRELAVAIERRLGRDAMVLQMPLLGFPEDTVHFPPGPSPLNPVVGGEEVFNGYELFRPTLYTDHLRWSYGRIQARPGDVQPAFAHKPFDRLLPEVVAAGFDGIYVDRRAFPDYAAALDSALTTQLGPPALTSPDGLSAFYDLQEYARRWRETTPRARAAELRRNATHPLQLEWSEGFLEADGIGRFFPQLPGFTSGRSASAGAVLEVSNPSGEPRVLELHASARLAAADPGRMVVRGGGRTAESMPAPPVPSTAMPALPVPSTAVPALPVPSTAVPALPVPSTAMPAAPVPSTAMVGPTPTTVTFEISVAPGTTRLVFDTEAVSAPGAQGADAHPDFRLEAVWWEG